MDADNDLAQLEAYSKELDLYTPLTIKSLIDAHRRLREWSKTEQEALRAARQSGFDAGFKSGEEMATKHHYISRESLRAMTLAELSDILFED